MLNWDIKTVALDSCNYPSRLRLIKNPPKLLYYAGEMVAEENCLAIVGSRICSPYGKETALEMAKKAAQSSLTVVSGLAAGIDSMAHQAAVQAKKRTIAVLGGGLDFQSFYPKQNLRLAGQIIENGGVLISEYPPKTKPANYTFPQRNRIISGLSLGVLVIEARIKSGALITADYAKKQNKKIFAVPGPIQSSSSRGCNLLIKKGARLTETIQDVLNELGLDCSEKPESSFLKSDNPKELLILKLLGEGSLNIEKIIEKTKINAAEAAGIISSMELKGIITDLGGNNYGINR
ncbi:MAG: DNA-processing protein DprA [Candidatus Pacebacteria bacterium]|nr:DNA-processing protein DprA [Candidatus Paceibacterota bacterium]MDD4875388.1 DNA-processing protein DprA [Candidatus Paceibacterota bacterium]